MIGSNWRQAVVCAVLAVAPLLAQAFKVETHVWIGQQLVNELSAGPSFTIPVNGVTTTVSLRPGVRDAILANTQTFLLGTIGPDAFPGVFEGQMTIHPGGKSAAVWGTGEWLAHVLTSAKTPRELAFAYGYLVHAASDIFAHTYVNQYAGDIFLMSDDVDIEARHFLLEGYVAHRTPPFVNADGSAAAAPAELLGGNGQAIPGEFLRRVFVDNAVAAREFRFNGSAHFAALYELNRMLDTLKDSEKSALGRLRLASKTLQETHERKMLEAKELADRIGEEEASADEVVPAGPPRFRWLQLVVSWQGLEADSKEAKDELKESLAQVKKNWTELQRESRQNSSSGRRKELYDGYKSSVKSVYAAARAMVKARVKSMQARIDWLKSFAAGKDRLTTYLTLWRKDNDRAMDAYFLKNAESMLTPPDKGDWIEPLKYWAACYAPILTGVPGPLKDADCEVRVTQKELEKSIEDMKVQMAASGTLEGNAVAVDREVRKVIKHASSDAVLSIVGRLSAPTFKQLVGAMREPASPARLTEVFAQPAKGGLVTFDNMAQRVDADMALDSTDRFDPLQFPVIYNAMMLSRMVLSDSQSLGTALGEPSFTAGGDAASGHFLFRLASSIDGNHQWLKVPPPYARADGKHRVVCSYGYAAAPSWWMKPDVREKIFKAIFKGPRTPALEASFTNYPYQPDNANPFPDYSGKCS